VLRDGVDLLGCNKVRVFRVNVFKIGLELLGVRSFQVPLLHDVGQLLWILGWVTKVDLRGAKVRRNVKVDQSPML